MSAPQEANIHSLQIGMEWLPDEPGSGVARMFYGLARHLPSRGVGVSGLVTGKVDSDNRPDSVKAFAPASGSVPSRLWKLRGAIQTHVRQTSPDVLSVHFPLYGLPALTVSRECPLVVHFHGPWALESKAENESALSVWGKRIAERLVYGNAERFIVLSEAFKKILTEQYTVPRSQVNVVPGGVEVDRFDVAYSRTEAREHLGWPTDRPIVFAVRRLVRRVGLDSLIDAMAIVGRRRPDVSLFIAGKGPLAHELQSRIEARGLEDHVTLLGFVPDDDLPLAYRAANLSVVPTHALEGFGLVAVESLAAGTPVIVTPVGGLPEVVSKLSESLVTYDASAEAIGTHLINALDDPKSLPSPETCRKFAASHYDWSVIARQVRSVYEEIC